MLKEFEHEKIARNEMSEDKVKEISEVLKSIDKGDEVKIVFYRDGHIINLKGLAQVEALDGYIKVGSFIIDFFDIKEISKL